MNIPSSTYRVQLHKSFTFRELEGIIDYLHALGITTIYAAPVLQATPGSMHGYDVTDPHTINSEVGTLSDLRSLSRKLKSKHMSWIQDIVPNHMAFNPMNFRLMDVLERGESSPYYRYFDIDWEHPSPHLTGKVQVPFLGDTPEACIERGEITVSFSDKGFSIDYLKTLYPLSLSAFEYLFEGTESSLFPWEEFVKMGQSVDDLNDWKKDREYYLSSIVNDEGRYMAILEFLEKVNKQPEKLAQLLKQQYYSLAYWKDTEKEINYRRFFTVNELICLRMEDPFVFEEYHKFIHSLYKEDLIQGLRIDHIDGLKDPSQYLSRLRKLFGDDCYIIAEKILESKEDMPEHWPLQGTSGYEFLAFTNQLMTSRKGAKEMLSFYKELMPQLPHYKDLVWGNKQLILEKHMPGEWDNLLHLFVQLGLSGNFEPQRLKQAIGTFMISLPVYRIYPDKLPLRGHDIAILNQAFEKAVAHNLSLKPELDHLKHLFTSKKENGAPHCSVLTFLQRLMQFTGPLTAKGVEDTTFYVYNALLSHDEVGDSPHSLGMSIAAFHKTMQERRQNTPLSLNASATHDTKRGEDARLRLNALCEFIEQWKTSVKEWMMVNREFHTWAPGKMMPNLNDEYYIYQSIAGGFPEDLNVSDEWIERILTHQTKALREAKVNTSWAEPNQEYEGACHAFIRSILKPGSKFLESFTPFIKRVMVLANYYAVAQTLLKITTPGIPDIYQGCELWDLSFVDPDNRRPVEYKKRKEFLSELEQRQKQGKNELLSFMEEYRMQGVEKLYVTLKALSFRRNNNSLFAEGAYIPLQIAGSDTTAIAFARRHEEQWVIIAIPLGIQNSEEVRPGDFEIILPEHSPVSWCNILTGETLHTQGRISASVPLILAPVSAGA